MTDCMKERDHPLIKLHIKKERKNESERESRYRRWCTEELPYQLLVPGQFEWNFTMFLLACHLLLLLLPPYLIIHTSCFLIPFLKCVCVCVCVCANSLTCVCVCVVCENSINLQTQSTYQQFLTVETCTEVASCTAMDTCSVPHYSLALAALTTDRLHWPILVTLTPAKYLQDQNANQTCT